MNEDELKLMREKEEQAYLTAREGMQIKKKPNKKNSGAWVEINTFARVVQRGLTRSEIAVWLVLWTYADRKTALSSRSFQQLAEESGCSQRAVVNAIASLTKKKLIKRVSKGSNLTHLASVYQVFFTPKGD